MNCCFEDCIVLDELIDECEHNWEKILNRYQLLRKPNADAIATLALQNFREMRDLVGSEAFLHRKHIEHDLTELYPEIFKSQYELVTFHTTPYEYALQMGAKNDRLLDKIIQEKLEDKLGDRQYMQGLIQEMLA
jgi:kynurenine 3-monooxygenase